MSVVSMTVAWSVGLSAFVPAAAVAAVCPELEAGDLFKVSGNSAVYLVSPEMKRMYFPNAEVYNSWYKDFSGITTIDSSCVDAYPSGGGVNFRPGSFLVKSAVSPSVFAVGPNNMKHKLGSEAVASALYGSNWGKLVRVLPDVFDSNYNVGAELTTAMLHNGQLVKKSGDSTVYFVMDGKTVKVEGSLPSQVAGDVRTVSEAVFSSVSMDSNTVTGSSVVSNPSQKGGSIVVPPVGNGKLKVSLAANTPAGTYALKNAARVPFTRVVVENTGATDVTIDSFKVVRGGSPALNSDFSTVNVVTEDGSLLNDTGKSLNSDNMATFTEDVVVKAGSSRTLTLVGDMANFSSGGAVPTLGLYSVEANATVDGSLPVYGNPVTTNASVTLSTATVAEGSTIGTVTKQVGSANVNLANVKVTAGTEDMKVERIVLNNSGSLADTDAEKFVLKYNGNTVANGTLKNKYLTFDLMNCGDLCKIEKGNDKTFEVYGDLTSGSGRSINLDVQRATHVLVKDLKNNFYVTPTNNASSMSNTVSVSQGKIDVSKTNDVQAGNIPENASGTKLGSWNFKVTGEPIDVRTLVFKITTTGSLSPDDVDSLTLYNKDGKALIGAVDGVGSSAASNGYATSTDSFTLQPGDNVLTVKGKIDSSATANDTVAISVDMSNSSNFDARGVNSNETITVGTYATPASVVAANTLTIKGSALRVTTLSTPPATTFAAGTNDVVFAKVLLDASDSSEDVKVTQFKVTDVTNTTAKAIDVQNIRLFVDKDGDSFNGAGTATALTETVSGSDSTAGNDEVFTFNFSGSDQFVIKAGKKVEVTVKANLAGSAAAGSHTLGVATADYVSATGVTTGNTVVETIDSAAGQAMSVGTAGGTVEVSLDPSTQAAKQYAAGTKGVSLATFRFTVTSSEDVSLDTLNLTQLVTDTASTSFKDYDMVYLYTTGGTLVGSAVPTSSGSVFIDLADNTFVAKASDTNGTSLVVKADLSSIGPSQNVTTGGHAIGYKINSAGQAKAKGALTGSASVVYFNSSAPTGNTHYMFKAVPTVQVCTGTVDDSNNCLKAGGSSPVLTNGSNDLIRFRVTANTGDVGLYKFTFDITTTTATVTTVELFDTTESNEVSLYSATMTASVPYVEALFDTDSSGVGSGGEERTVSAGTSRYFVLRGTATGVTTGASVSTRLGGDSANSAGISSARVMDPASTVDATANIHDDFIWSDRSAGSHSTSTNDWTNGYLVSGLNSASSSPVVLAK